MHMVVPSYDAMKSDIENFRRDLDTPYSGHFTTVHFRYDDWEANPRLSPEVAANCVLSLSFKPESCLARSFSSTQIDSLLKHGTDRDNYSALDEWDRRVHGEIDFLQKEWLTYASSLTEHGGLWVNDKKAVCFWDVNALVHVPHASYGLHAFRKDGARNGLIAVVSTKGDIPIPR